jgi:ClpP class serine protease
LLRAVFYYWLDWRGGADPNFNRFLKIKIDIELHTAGQYKRTLTLLGENTEEGRQKFPRRPQ